MVPGIYAQEQGTIDLARSPLEHARALAPLGETEARTFLHLFLFAGDMVMRPSGVLSYGERARLQLAMLVLRGANLLLLDEPLNHLDLTSRERFEEALLGFEGTLIAVLHDRYAIDRLATRLLRPRPRAVARDVGPIVVSRRSPHVARGYPGGVPPGFRPPNTASSK